eukprot:TRINITY_DN5486_c0_g1_i1.p1 TRINITY_DN5486_c0_g1~~TRINITY_DN5486_c0_g1_i1.p1  ORF type:complete len:696 (-),score=222.75 TRINITY_DN5486_c0_g1_i1:722-2809(-)
MTDKLSYSISGKGCKGGILGTMIIFNVTMFVNGNLPESQKEDLQIFIEPEEEAFVSIMGGVKGTFSIGFKPKVAGYYWVDFVFKGQWAPNPYPLPVAAPGQTMNASQYKGIHRQVAKDPQANKMLLEEKRKKEQEDKEKAKQLEENERRKAAEKSKFKHIPAPASAHPHAPPHTIPHFSQEAKDSDRRMDKKHESKTESDISSEAPEEQRKRREEAERKVERWKQEEEKRKKENAEKLKLQEEAHNAENAEKKKLQQRQQPHPHIPPQPSQPPQQEDSKKVPPVERKVVTRALVNSMPARPADPQEGPQSSEGKAPLSPQKAPLQVKHITKVSVTVNTSQPHSPRLSNHAPQEASNAHPPPQTATTPVKASSAAPQRSRLSSLPASALSNHASGGAPSSPRQAVPSLTESATLRNPRAPPEAQQPAPSPNPTQAPDTDPPRRRMSLRDTRLPPSQLVPPLKSPRAMVSKERKNQGDVHPNEEAEEPLSDAKLTDKSIEDRKKKLFARNNPPKTNGPPLSPRGEAAEAEKNAETAPKAKLSGVEFFENLSKTESVQNDKVVPLQPTSSRGTYVQKYLDTTSELLKQPTKVESQQIHKVSIPNLSNPGAPSLRSPVTSPRALEDSSLAPFSGRSGLVPVVQKEMEDLKTKIKTDKDRLLKILAAFESESDRGTRGWITNRRGWIGLKKTSSCWWRWV